MIRPVTPFIVNSYCLIPPCKSAGRSRSAQRAMQVFPLIKQFAAVGAACYIVSHPLTCYAAPSDRISGSDDAPPTSELQQGGEDKQPPNFNYTHLWYAFDPEDADNFHYDLLGNTALLCVLTMFGKSRMRMQDEQRWRDAHCRGQNERIHPEGICSERSSTV